MRKDPPVRRRDERIPERLPRVGERPAGAERGVDLAMPVLILVVEDLGLRCARGRGVATVLGVLPYETSPVVADLVRMNDGLTKESFEKELLSVPLGRLEKSNGSTFSKSSASKISDAFRFPGDVEIAARLFSQVQHDLLD